ncbi:MAG: AAA family ATPase, partial [Acidaminococcaceae bacterium]|nr:AAA family ATPase [Acidaminococcaceae bacterium]
MERKIMNRLLAWKDKSDRKPLLLNGARQVGKTYILQKLGREHYDNMVYVNLEKNLLVAGFFQDNIDPHRIIRYLEASTQEKIAPGKTLIVLDEIQACERALTALKYFCEEAPEYHVAAAGS